MKFPSDRHKQNIKNQYNSIPQSFNPSVLPSLNPSILRAFNPSILQSFSYSILLFVLMSCANRPGVHTRQFRQMVDQSPVFDQNFTGFALYDPERDEMVYEYQADKYYTPASNTKIFTLYACLKMLGDSIPALQYAVNGDSLIFTGTGDPTFLHPDIYRFDTTHQQGVYHFLQSAEQPLFYIERPSQDDYFGPGWAWSDYNYYYSTEKSVFPIYANLVRFQFKKHLPKPLAYPDFFTSYITGFASEAVLPDYIRRNQHDNYFQYAPKDDTLAFTEDIPFKYSTDLLLNLLADTLHRKVNRYQGSLKTFPQTIYSVPADSVYRRMMHISDNFLAEQLLLVCSSQFRDTLSIDSAIAYVKQHYLEDLPDEPVWVDGSGLSRYNLQTPRTIVALLRKVDEELEDEEIFNIFPAGGVSGTIQDWYKNEAGEPYVFAKTGTLSNKHALSGYLITRTGKKLIFSFMHNNYVTSSSVYKFEMEKILKAIHQDY